MTDQISTQASSATAARDAMSSTTEAVRHAGDVLGQTRAVVAVREQFNPLGVGLRSIWPQSVVGF
ncbi:hypothetical protein J2Y66_002830 [Paenarthrobacter nitroguajacolicus]|uniref:hypothetical protein n=1 Tax=Paenarthrobacter nitroguajacolicus TaxID=211146 RepID=UPI00285B8D42|nr:hypothetical protein [Paenarthrobacter nitroguajacolicus]MDR6988326.1 hypothetical protein [Paenarthrobacter nitroguajacolicus]